MFQYIDSYVAISSSNVTKRFVARSTHGKLMQRLVGSLRLQLSLCEFMSLLFTSVVLHQPFCMYVNEGPAKFFARFPISVVGRYVC